MYFDLKSFFVKLYDYYHFTLFGTKMTDKEQDKCLEIVSDLERDIAQNALTDFKK